MTKSETKAMPFLFETTDTVKDKTASCGTVEASMPLYKRNFLSVLIAE
jgi:hypothetical protein